MQRSISSSTFASDKAMFHVNGTVNRHSCKIWAYENPHVTSELERGNAKVSVRVGWMHDTLIGPFFCSEETVTGISYLELFAVP